MPYPVTQLVAVPRPVEPLPIQRSLRYHTYMARVTELNVNGTPRRIDADPNRTLLSVLRDDLDLTGTKFGCGEGQCGACTVLIHGNAVRSCQAPVRGAAGN